MDNEDKYKEALWHLSILKDEHNMLWNRHPNWWIGMQLLAELKSDCHEEGKKAFESFHHELSDFFARRAWNTESSMKPVECTHCKSVKYFMVKSEMTEERAVELLKIRYEREKDEE